MSLDWGSQARRKLDVWPEAACVAGGDLELKARIEPEGERPIHLWYRLPAAHQKDVTAWADPFVIGTVFYAMRRASELHVHGTVSPSLLRNLEEFQSAWACWKPEEFRRVPISADREAEEPRAETDATVMTFSGGLDSCFTAWRHTKGDGGRRRRALKAAVMVHGFDIPLAEKEVFDRAAENSRKITESIGVELIPMACNFRQLGDEWEQAHGAALASCLQMVRRSYSSALVAGSHVYSALRFPWGSNPLTDVMLAAESLPIVYDGCDYSRREKAREVANWSEAMARVRVCWEGEHKDQNCGICVRCVGTAICFAMENKAIPGSLPVGSLEDAIRKLDSTVLKPVVVTRFEELALTARKAGQQGAWVDALEECVRRQRGRKETRIARTRKKLVRAWGRLWKRPQFKRA